MLTLVATAALLPPTSVGPAAWLEPAGAVPSGTELEPPIAAAGAEELELAVALTGQTVVDTAMTEVTTVVDAAGQSVTVGAQLVMVILWVE